MQIYFFPYITVCAYSLPANQIVDRYTLIPQSETMIPMTEITNSRLFLWRWKLKLSLKHYAANHYQCIIYPHLKEVQESFDVTKELFHGGLLDVQAEILNQFLVHGGHVFMHFDQNIDLVFGAAVETVSAVKEITYVPSLN